MFVVWLSVVSFCAVLVRVQRVRLGGSKSLADLTGGTGSRAPTSGETFFTKTDFMTNWPTPEVVQMHKSVQLWGGALSP